MRNVIKKQANWIRKLNFESRQKIKEMFVEGASIPKLSKIFKVDRKTIYYHVKNISFKNGKIEEVIIKKSIKNSYNPISKKNLKLPKEKSYKDYLNEEKKKIKERGGINYLPRLKDLKS